MRVASLELSECLLTHSSRYPWHDAARWCQLSHAWHATITAWRSEQSTMSITARKSDGEWLDAWDRPSFDVASFRALVRDSPRVTVIELLWWTINNVIIQAFLGWSKLEVILLETCCVLGGPNALEPLVDSGRGVCDRVKRLSLWTWDGISKRPSFFDSFLSSFRNLQAVTLNLQAFTQARRDDPSSRVELEGGFIILALSTIKTLQRVALYEMKSARVNLDGTLPTLFRNCALTSFKVAECLDIIEDDLGCINAMPSHASCETL
jgi:hypothetical protein